MFRKGVLLFLVIALAAGLMAGCSQSQPTAPATPAQPKQPKILRLPSNKAASTANIHLASMDSDSEIVSLITGTLYTWMPLADKSNAVVAPELAAGEPKNPSGDGKVWQIPINKNAKWENGDPINADTFIYSWKMMLDPKMVNAQASSFASNFVEIKNAMAYFKQASAKPKVDIPWENVGIRKLDDYTLELTLAGDYTAIDVMRHFTFSRSGPVYQKIYDAKMNADRTATQWGTSQDTVISSGPYKMVKWVKGAERVFEKNPNYVLADKIKLDGITYRVVEDTGTQVQMFEKKELDYITLSTEGINTYAEDPRVLPGSSRYVRQLEINDTYPDLPILKNINFKKALYYGIDRNTIAKLAKKIPAPWIVPFTSVAYTDGTLFRTLADKAGYVPKNGGYDPQLAKKYFDQALKEEGLTKVDIALNYTTTVDDHKIIAEFIQQSLPKIFGEDKFHFTLVGMPSAQNLDTLKASPTNPKAYQISMSQWSLTASDFSPNKIFEVYTSDYARRNGPYHSKALDDLYRQSVSDAVRKDEKKVAELTLQMEKVFIDEVIAIPVIQTVSLGMASDRLILPLKERHNTAGWLLSFADLKQ